MAYATNNPKTKKILKEWVANKKLIGVFNPSGMFPDPVDGEVVIEGPQYPEAHKWYALVMVQDGYIRKVIS
jgi:hypothetical protein